VAQLLVSVRSVDEALAALAGGAAVIDVKEPDRGPLGCADFEVCRAVRRAVPPGIPVSVALGELRDWQAPGSSCLTPPSNLFAGITFRKLGLAGAGPDWAEAWAVLRRAWGPGPSWVAVAYADWERADAPHPDAVLDAALATTDCAGVLVDTWDKTRPNPIDASWGPWVARARRGGRRVALAGGLNAADIARLAPLRPDLFAVRGAACRYGDRLAAVEPDRVALLVRAIVP